MNAFSTRHLAQILSVFVLLLALTAATGAYAQSVTATVAAGTAPIAVAINPVTNKIYVANTGGNDVAVIDAAPSTFTQHRTSVTMAGGNVTSRTNPTLALTVSGAYSPTNPAIRTVYYRLNYSQGAFTGSGPYSAALSGLTVGFNTVSLFAVDAIEAPSKPPKTGQKNAQKTD